MPTVGFPRVPAPPRPSWWPVGLPWPGGDVPQFGGGSGFDEGFSQGFAGFGPRRGGPHAELSETQRRQARFRKLRTKRSAVEDIRSQALNAFLEDRGFREFIDAQVPEGGTADEMAAANIIARQMFAEANMPDFVADIAPIQRQLDSLTRRTDRAERRLRRSQKRLESRPREKTI